ncbi:type II toxin-antitoxin system VapB family antitoxin [Acidovorax sp. BL-A-41-H1]|uniref:type II toxin-antitoxin system VapB family antitoxin n=1 Tax=Acidovorax sp. BL-A-41-H1 TaxID=3421102 RepID=UPI003F795AE7
MQVMMTIDDELYARAMDLADAGLDPSELVSEALKTFVRVQNAKRLAALGGAAPHMQAVPRRSEEAD